MKYYLLLLFFLSFSPRAAETKPIELKVAILSVDAQQISAYANWANQFEKIHPEIALSIDYFTDGTYKARLDAWLENGAYDVMYWQGGARLSRLVEKNLLIPISTLVDTNKLIQFVPQPVLDQVTYDGKIQALPYAQYSWGFYYNKALFAENNIRPPQNWQQFLTIIKKLKQKDIYPFVQANSEGWPALAWLDYLSFQTGGHELRNKLLLNNPLSYSEKIKLLNAFSDLTADEYFVARDFPWSWQQAVFMVGRKQAAMTLMGQFAESVLNHKMSDKIGFFNFPAVGDSLLSMAPLEVFMVPKKATNLSAAKQFLSFLLNPKHQTELALNLGWLPIHLEQINSADITTRQQVAIDYLRRSYSRIQYFDRESEGTIAKNFINSLSQVFSDRAVDSLDAALSGLTVEPSPILNQDPNSAVFKLSAIKGHRSVFLASAILRQVYGAMSFDLAITRLPNTTEAIASYNTGIDGELIRIKEFENLTEELVRISEPLFSVSLILITRGSECESIQSIQRKKAKIGVSLDAILLELWAKENNVELRQFNQQETLWELFRRGEISHILSTQSDLSFESGSIEHCSEVQQTIPLYHYIHKKHADMSMLLNEKIVEFKKTQAYDNILKSFGLN